jgi:hypothetical protein
MQKSPLGGCPAVIGLGTVRNAYTVARRSPDVTVYFAHADIQVKLLRLALSGTIKGEDGESLVRSTPK